jgi:membrane-anchored mycosin MYCP
MRRWVGLLLMGVLVAVLADPATEPARAAIVPALAPPTCTDRPAPAPTVSEVPWPQQRYAPDRLAPLATGAGITVAVIDSGVDATHPQLQGRTADGADYLDPGGDGTVDCAEHGTAVASIIAAEPRPNIGFHGLAPRARILPVRVSEQLIVDGREAGRTVSAAEFARAIRWAVDNGADVLNLSVVLFQDDPDVREAVRFALDRDVVVVAAVGNLHSNGDPTPYPAAYPGVLGVGAIGPDGMRAQFSQIGPYVDVVAPGIDVLAAVPGEGHKRHSGTSYAAPFVAATAALVREYRPDLSAAEVVERIVATADPAPAGGHSDEYGAGVLNPYRAVVDTAAVEHRTTHAALPPAQPEAGASADRVRARVISLWIAAAGAGIVGATALAVLVLPRGKRRRWQPASSRWSGW